jgi:hypothetical protein
MCALALAFPGQRQPVDQSRKPQLFNLIRKRLKIRYINAKFAFAKKSFMPRYLTILIALLFGVLPLSAQDENIRYEDYVYVENIRSVQFYVSGLMTSNPIITLNAPTQLYFAFDDLEDQVKTYTYSFQHCDADWTPSGLVETEYINGFTENYIEDYEYSFNTIVPYINYFLSFPNRDFTFSKSGNYLLKVYENEGDKRLVITRRFMVVRPVVQVAPQMSRPAAVRKSDTHQEIDFAVLFPDLNIRNPLVEVSATILQNGRWDNAVVNIRPRLVRPKELIFDYQDKVVFPGGKEFRWLDLRSLRYPSERILEVQRYDDGFDVTLMKDEKRGYEFYLDFNDLNGRFVLGTTDYNNPDLQSDYANVLFTLYSPTEYSSGEVYVYGGLTNWAIMPEFKLVYNNRINCYVGEALLKEGYYDYSYVHVDEEGNLDFRDTEGNWYETNNEYTILVYYRPFGSRFDQLIATRSFTSRS